MEQLLKELHLPAMRGVRGAGAAGPAGVAELRASTCWSWRSGSARSGSNTRIERLLRQSRLPLEKSWQALDLKRLPAKVVQQVRGCLSGEVRGPARERAGVRPAGLGQDACRVRVGAGTGACAGGGCCSRRAEPAGAGLLAAKRDLKLPRLLKRLAGYEVLMLDDLGLRAAEPGGDGGAVHAAGGALRAGQRDADEQPGVLGVGAIFKDPMTTAAAIDRLVHHSVIVELNVPSYRAEAAKLSGRRTTSRRGRRPAAETRWGRVIVAHGEGKLSPFGPPLPRPRQAPYGPLPRKWAQFKGTYAYGNQTVIALHRRRRGDPRGGRGRGGRQEGHRVHPHAGGGQVVPRPARPHRPGRDGRRRRR